MLLIVMLLLVAIAVQPLNEASIEAAQTIERIKSEQRRQYLQSVYHALESDAGYAHFPRTVSALAAETGHRHIKDYTRASISQQNYSSRNDGVWTFSRYVTFIVDPGSGQSISDQLTNPLCGGAPVNHAWCARKDLNGFVFESRTVNNLTLGLQRERQQRTLQKFADYFSANQAFPSQTNGGTALVANSVQTFKSLTGFSGTATTCTDTFIYRGIPLECDDLYSVWGTEVGYYFTSNKNIAIVSDSTISDASGTPVVVASEIKIP